MKPTLKSKTKELLAQKEADIPILNEELNILKSKQKIERNLSKEIFTLSKITIDKQIASVTATRQATREFIVELIGILNWA